MNSSYVGPEFVLSQRYSQLVTTFLVLFMYVGSFPLFGLVGTASFYLAYWVDKFLFLRFYATPTRYPASVGLHATALIPYAVVAHLILSLWAVSQSDVFATAHSGSSYGESVYGLAGLATVDPGGLKKLISERHTVYLAMLLLLIVLAIFVKWVVHHFLYAGSHISQLLCSCDFEFMAKYSFFFSSKRFQKSKLLSMSFPRAVRRGYIKGLDNYNILQNQRYKDAFHIDDVPHSLHRRVRSMLASSSDIHPQRTGAPKPLPEDDPIEQAAFAMFQLNRGGGGGDRGGGKDRGGGDRERGGGGERSPRRTPRGGGHTPRSGDGGPPIAVCYYAIVIDWMLICY
jgi:uncharacterized membrane protein YgcG